MAQTSVGVVNKAIGFVGGEPVESLTEDTPLGAYCQDQYPAKRDLLLGMYRWVFANRFVQLDKIVPVPPNVPLSNLFSLPGDLIGAIHAFRDGPRVDANNVRCLVGDVGVASDFAPVYAEYTARVEEVKWPVWFTELVATAFAADLARRRPNAALAKDLDARAFGPPEANGEGGLYLAARNADSRDAPERALFYDSAGPLIEARFGGGWPTAQLGPFRTIDTSEG